MDIIYKYSLLIKDTNTSGISNYFSCVFTGTEVRCFDGPIHLISIIICSLMG